MEGSDEIECDKLQFISEITFDPRDIHITKQHSNAFWNTELEQILLNNGIGLVIVAGFAAEHCVLFTYNGAIERGFKPVILHNGIISTHNDVIHSTYRDRNLISYPVLEFLCSGSL